MRNETIYIPKSFAIKVRLVSLSILLLFHTNEVTQVNVAIPAFSFVVIQRYSFKTRGQFCWVNWEFNNEL